MASIGEDLITFALTSTAITSVVRSRIHESKIPENSQYPLIWLARSGKEKDKDLQQQGGITRHLFDLECCSTSLDQADDLAETVDTFLAGHRGTFGSRFALGVFVEDQDEQYIPRGNADDEGVHVAALQIQIWTH